MQNISEKTKDCSFINKDANFIGYGKSLQSLIDQETGTKSFTNVNTLPMNIEGSIGNVCYHRRTIKNNLLEPNDVYEDKVCYVYNESV